jgi:hypothetical protein
MNVKEIYMKSKPKSKVFCFGQMAPSNVLRKGDTQHPAELINSSHMLRDCSSGLMIYSKLKDLYDFGGILLNLPPEIYEYDLPNNTSCDYFNSSDLILMTTRPALDDDSINDKRHLHRSHSNFENTLYESNLRIIFTVCSRQNIILSDFVMSHIGTGDPRRIYRGIRYSIYKGAFYTSCADTDNPVDLEKHTNQRDMTVGYLVFLPHINVIDHPLTKGPGFLLIFGLNGTTTMLWSNLIVRKYAKLLTNIVMSNKATLVMVEFSPMFNENYLPFCVNDIVINREKILINIPLNM